MTSKDPFSGIDFAKLFTDLKLAGFDPQALIDARRRELEALGKASQVTPKGHEAVAERQAEIMREMIAALQKQVGELAAALSPREAAEKQLEFAKTAFDSALRCMRDVAEEAVKTNNEVLGTMGRRTAESLDEIKDRIKKP